MKTTLSKFAMLVFAGSILFSSCASITTKSNYPLSVTSYPSGASFTITDDSGLEICKGRTPAVVKLAASASYMKPAKYNIALTDTAFETQTSFRKASIEGMYFGNFIFGGLVGFLLVDPLTGAMFRLDNTPVHFELRGMDKIPTMN